MSYIDNPLLAHWESQRDMVWTSNRMVKERFAQRLLISFPHTNEGPDENPSEDKPPEIAQPLFCSPCQVWKRRRCALWASCKTTQAAFSSLLPVVRG